MKIMILIIYYYYFLFNLFLFYFYYSRMDDALHLFDEICNNDIFKKTAIMLFLSKIDIFREKIKTSSISTYFPSFKGLYFIYV